MKKLLSELKKVNLPKGKYAIFGSGPICVRGLREAKHDLDVIVTPSVWAEYSSKLGWVKKKLPNGDIYLELKGKNIELYQTWSPGKWNLEKIIEEAEIIDNLPYVRLETVLDWKKKNGREKDIKDIELIEKYLAGNQAISV